MRCRGMSGEKGWVATCSYSAGINPSHAVDGQDLALAGTSNSVGRCR